MEIGETYTIKPDESALIKLFQMLLEEKIVDSVLGFEIRKNRYDLFPKAFEDPKQITLLPLSQYLAYNYTRVNSSSKFVHKNMDPRNKKIALIARPCDTRAFIELSKFNQLKIENLFIIGTRCIGSISAADVQKVITDLKLDPEKVEIEELGLDSLKILVDGEIQEIKFNDTINRWDNCNRCAKREPAIVDLLLDFYFDDSKKVITLTILSEKGKEVLEKTKSSKKIELEKTKAADVKKREDLIQKIMTQAKEYREKTIAEFQNLTDEQKFERIAKEFLEPCRVCGQCINACPVCYCPECDIARRRKEKEAGFDANLYLLTKMAHMGDLCIGCGKCTIVCPAKIPSAFFYDVLTDYVKKAFGYEPGKSIEDLYPRTMKAIKKTK